MDPQPSLEHPPKPWLAAIGALDPHLLAELAARLECSTAALAVDPSPAFDPRRNQYDSTVLLGQLPKGVLAVVPFDLHIPILEFVFGEAVQSGLCAVVSCHRLYQEFYGLPADYDLLVQRVLKVCRHEWGHALGLRHCPLYECAMHAAHSVELVDLKRDEFCPACTGRLLEPAASSLRRPARSVHSRGADEERLRSVARQTAHRRETRPSCRAEPEGPPAPLPPAGKSG